MAGAVPPTRTHGWLKVLEEHPRGTWAWRLRHFELTEASFTWTNGDGAGLVGFVSLFDVLAVRCGPRSGGNHGSAAAAAVAAGVGHDITLVDAQGQLLRMRAPTPAHAGRWLTALRAAAAACSATGSPPPSTCKEEEANGGLEAAALTASDDATFPGDAAELSPLAVSRATTSACRCCSSLAAKSSAPSPRASGGSALATPAAASAAPATPRAATSHPPIDGTASAAAPATSAPMSAAAAHRHEHAQQIKVGAQTPAQHSTATERTPPWPTAASGSARRDLRPTHDRFSYSPSLTNATRRISSGRASRPIVERLYDEGLQQHAARRRSLEALDLQSFDYAVRAGLEADGVRGAKEAERKAVSHVHEARMLADGNCTFTPHILRAEDETAAGLPAWDTAVGPVWDRLHLMAADRREVRARTEQVAQMREVARTGTFTPEISSRAKALAREGPVEDRLISDWAERLVAFEERMAEEREEELSKSAAQRRQATMTRAEAEARTAQMHYEGSVHLKQRKELALQAEREAAARAAKDAQRTAGARRVSTAEGERLYQRALEKQRQAAERARQQKPARSQNAVAIEEKACDRLYQRAQEQRRRASAAASPAAATPPPMTPVMSPSPTSANRSPGVLTKQKSVSRAEAEARGAQMHYEAMVRAQQKEQVALQAKREEEALAAERVHRTAGARRVGTAHSVHLYQNAVKQQQKHEQMVVERQKQLEAAELEGTTFKPQVSQLAKQLSTDGLSVEQRTMAWHHAKQASKQLKNEVTATGGVAPTSMRRKSSGDPAYFGGKARTVDQF